MCEKITKFVLYNIVVKHISLKIYGKKTCFRTQTA